MVGGGVLRYVGRWCLYKPMLRHPFPLRDQSKDYSIDYSIV